MAVTFTPTVLGSTDLGGGRKLTTVDISCTGTPTVGGDALTAAQLGFANNELEYVSATGCAGVSGATSAAALQVIHGSGRYLSQVLIAFMVQGTAGAANSMVAYTGSTANFIFRVTALGKGTFAQ